MQAIINITTGFVRYLIHYLLLYLSLGMISTEVPGNKNARVLAHLTTLLEAGYPLKTAVEHLTAYNIPHKRKIRRIITKLENGVPFAFAYRECFKHYVHQRTMRLIETAEKKGRPADFLNVFLEFDAIQKDLSQRKTDAVTYPLFLLVIGFVTMITLNIFVVPVFEQLYGDWGGSLPLMTRFLIAGLDVLMSNLFYLIGFFIILLIVLKNYRLSFKGRVHIYYIALLVREMVKGGDSVTDAFYEAAKIVGDEKYKRAAADIIQKAKNGLSLESSLQNRRFWVGDFMHTIIAAGVSRDSLSVLNHFLTGFKVRHQIHIERFFRRLGFYILLVNGVVVGF